MTSPVFYKKNLCAILVQLKPSFFWRIGRTLLAGASRRLGHKLLADHFITSLFGNLSNPKPHKQRAGRVGAPGGTARRGRARLGELELFGQQETNSVYPPRNRKNVTEAFFQKHEQAKYYSNVLLEDERPSSILDADCMLTSTPTLFCKHQQNNS